MATAPQAPVSAPVAPAAPVRVRSLRRRQKSGALERLHRDPVTNLFLIDLVERLGDSAARGEPSPDLLGAWRGEVLVGVAARRPTMVLEDALEPVVLEALVPRLAEAAAGLIRSPARQVAPLWAELQRHGRRALVDRAEAVLRLVQADACLVAPPAGIRVRSARRDDLDALIDAARESLREEGRPDPFLGDPRGFRRWVRGRLPDAVVGEVDGRALFAGYADVRRPEGWLLQGVYTEPVGRRGGLASVGVSELCRRAFDAGADHVQLSVVEGNAPARALYEKLGFRPFASLRTLLFV